MPTTTVGIATGRFDEDAERPLAREAIAREHVRGEGAEDGVDGRRRERDEEREAQRELRLGRRERVDERGRPPRNAKTKTAASGIRMSGRRTSSTTRDGRGGPAARRSARAVGAHRLPTDFMTRSFQMPSTISRLRLRPAAESAIRERLLDVSERGVVVPRLFDAAESASDEEASEPPRSRGSGTKASTAARSFGRMWRSITTRVCSERIVRRG